MKIAKLEKGTVIKIRGVPVVLHEDALIETTETTQTLLRNLFTAFSEKPYAAQLPGMISATSCPGYPSH